MPNNLFWAGSDTSYQLYLDAVKKFEGLSPDAYGSVVESDEEVKQIPRLYSVVGNVGLITISGALVNKESWWTRWAGMTSYESIREALVYALEDSSIEKILLDIASPGGQVAGCEDCANLVSEVSKIKEVSAFSDAYVASAAYWLGSAAHKRFTSKSAMWGSIGVIMRHAEISKMRKEAGITDTIFRSGPWKGIGGGEEKLSDLAKIDFQEKTDYLATVFVDSVAENLNITAAFVDETMGKGREFIGQQAVDVGLCSSVESFDAVISKLQVADDSAGGIIMPKKSLTPQAIAALAAGATPEAEGSSDVPAADASQEEVVVVPEAADENVEPDESVEVDASEKVLDAEMTSVLAKNDLLTEQLAAATGENLKLKMAAESHEKELSGVDSLKVIASTFVNNMLIATGAAALDLSAHSASDIVALHATTAQTFESTFKAGGVASIATDAAKDEVEEIANLDSVGI